MMIEQAMSGIKVIDFSMGVDGPHAGTLMAQNGADVIKVEPPEGDWGRTLGTTYGDLSAHSFVFQRGKRSIALDLKSEGGRQIANELVASADVILESFRPGVMKRFGLSYEQVAAVNPDVVYLSVTGFGQIGPNAMLPATDAVAQARSGLMSLNKDRNGLPQRVELIVIDVATGLYAFQAVSTALLRRFRFGKGAYIDCSLLQSAYAMQSAKIIEEYLEGSDRPVIYSPLGVLQTLDGYITISVMRDSHFIEFCGAIGRPEFASDARFATRSARVTNDGELMDILRSLFKTKSTLDWNNLLTEAGVLNSPVLTYAQCLTEDEHIKSAFTWIKQAEFGGPIPVSNVPGLNPDATLRAPLIGEHSREILASLGRTPAESDRLIQVGTVK